MHNHRHTPHPYLAALIGATAALFSGCGGTMQAYNTHHALYKAPLAPYVQACMQPREMIGRDGFGVVEVSPAVGTHHRPLVFDDLPDSVSVQTGHRVMYAFKDAGYFFANVKIERSKAAEYGRDKEVIARYHRSAGLNREAPFRGVSLRNGLELHESERDSIDVGGVIGVYSAFLDRDHLVLTAYLLNQEKKKRRFNTIEEYRALRDRFLNDLTACVAAGADSVAP